MYHDASCRCSFTLSEYVTVIVKKGIGLTEKEGLLFFFRPVLLERDKTSNWTQCPSRSKLRLNQLTAKYRGS